MFLSNHGRGLKQPDGTTRDVKFPELQQVSAHILVPDFMSIVLANLVATVNLSRLSATTRAAQCRGHGSMSREAHTKQARRLAPQLCGLAVEARGHCNHRHPPDTPAAERSAVPTHGDERHAQSSLSLVCGPYTSLVSRSVWPSSPARRITAGASSSPTGFVAWYAKLKPTAAEHPKYHTSQLPAATVHAACCITTRCL